MCMIDGGEYCAVFVTKTRKARKPHQCEECGRLISPTERYRYQSWVMEGSAASAAMCGHCEAAADWLVINCGGYLVGGVTEDIREHILEYPSIAFGLQRLKVGIQRQWRRFDGVGLMPVERVPAGVDRVMTDA